MPQVEEIVPDLDKIELQIPLHSLKTVFVYLFRDGNEGLLVDCGWNDEKSWASLNESFSLLDFDIKNLKTLIISHLHPDHFGLASRLKREAPEMKIVMHERDARDIIHTPEAYKVLLEKMRSFVRINGTPEEIVVKMGETTRPLEKLFSALAKPDALVKGGEKFSLGKWNLEVISTPGHTKGNICLYDQRTNIFFSGDHILPKITPNVSLSPLYEGDPLGDYLRSLNHLKKYDPVKILPSHEWVFENLRKRIEEIEKHHENRLAEVLETLDEEKSGYEIAEKLTWSSGTFDSLSPWSKRAALGETLAHLEYLKRIRQVIELHEGAGAEETIRYTRSF